MAARPRPELAFFSSALSAGTVASDRPPVRGSRFCLAPGRPHFRPLPLSRAALATGSVLWSRSRKQDRAGVGRGSSGQAAPCSRTALPLLPLWLPETAAGSS